MCKGSQNTQTTQTTSANPAAMAAYGNILGRAQSVGSRPYVPFTGELVAPVNEQQQMGIANINANAGFAAPYIQEAAGYARSGATPISPEDIQRFYDPFAGQVIDATQAQFNTQNQSQLSGVLGNAIAQGALGGNRSAIAQAETVAAQQQAQAPVLAALRSQGFTTGLNAALTEKNLQQAGAAQLGSLGVAGQNAALTGANSQIGAGTLLQGTRQAEDAARYGQFQQEQAFPYQQLQWLASLASGVGSQMGGTSTTTQPPPSPLSQWGGVATAGIGALGKSGALTGIGSILGSALAMLATGGGVPEDGGVANMGPTIPETPETLALQQRQLLSGHRRAQMFPHGTPELPLPDGADRVEADNGVFHFDPRRISRDDILGAVQGGRENELLDLGSFNKNDILARVRAGEAPVAIVERDQNGVEVRAAIGTDRTARQQLAEMEGTASPGHTVRVEDVRSVVGGRLNRQIAVPQRDLGGPVQGVGAAPYGSGADLWSGVSGYVPQAQISRGAGAPRPPAAPEQDDSKRLQEQARQIGELASLIRTPPGVAGPMALTPSGVAPPLSAVGDIGGSGRAGDIILGPDAGSSGAIYSRGGGVSNPVRGYAAGGAPDDFDDRFSGAPAPSYNDLPDWVAYGTDVPSAGEPRQSGVAPPSALRLSQGREGVGSPGIVPMPEPRPAAPRAPVRTASADTVGYGYAEPSDMPDRSPFVPSRPPSPRGVIPGYRGSPIEPAVERSSPRAAAPAAAPERGVSNIDFSADSKLWPALMAAGFGMMSSRSPHPGVAIGEGGLAGVNAYASANEAENRNKMKQAEIDMAARRLSAQIEHQRDTLAETSRYHSGMLARDNYQYVGVNEEGKPIYHDRLHGTEKVGSNVVTGKPGAGRGGDTAKVLQIADALQAAREEARKTNPDLPPLPREEAIERAQRPPREGQDTIARERLASNAHKFDLDGRGLDYWRNFYGLPPAGQRQPAAPAPAGAAPAPPAPPAAASAPKWSNSAPGTAPYAGKTNPATVTPPEPPRPPGTKGNWGRQKSTGLYGWLDRDNGSFLAAEPQPSR